MDRLIRIVAIALFLMEILGCGGGTSGTGLRTYSGRVSDADGAQLPDVNVVIESTGDSSITDQNGMFVIRSSAFGHKVPFLLESSKFVSRFVVPNVEEESSRVSLDVQVDTETDSATVHNLNVRAWFAGRCDSYFENAEIIRQANRVPGGTVCSLNVRVLGDGRLLSGIPLALQYARCAPQSPWQDLIASATGVGQHKGFAEINFEFKDSDEFCRYRVIAPSHGSKFRPVTYAIDTFSEQAYVDSPSKH